MLLPMGLHRLAAFLLHLVQLGLLVGVEQRGKLRVGILEHLVHPLGHVHSDRMELRGGVLDDGMDLRDLIRRQVQLLLEPGLDAALHLRLTRGSEEIGLGLIHAEGAARDSSGHKDRRGISDGFPLGNLAHGRSADTS